jgi:hypothetical protein
VKTLCKNTILIFCVLWLSACAKKVPLSKAKMVDVMTDVMQLEAGHQLKYNGGIIPDTFWQRDYAFVFKKHNVSEADFRLTVEEYQKQPETYSKVMEQVITRLQKMEIKRQTKNPDNDVPPEMKLKDLPKGGNPSGMITVPKS